jgi:hypothetical protein
MENQNYHADSNRKECWVELLFSGAVIARQPIRLSS